MTCMYVKTKTVDVHFTGQQTKVIPNFAKSLICILCKFCGLLTLEQEHGGRVYSRGTNYNKYGIARAALGGCLLDQGH